MTKKLETLFELPADDDININETDLSQPLTENAKEITQTALNNLEKIEAALPQIKDLEEADAELDELAQLATDSFKDLQDLGFQVESRFSSEIFSAAGTMLGHAINAKTVKVNKKLKQLDLMLKKAQLDHKIETDKKKNNPEDETPLDDIPAGTGKELDRNELLKLLTSRE
jgi:hypothetical protein